MIVNSLAFKINYDLPVDDNHEQTYIHRIGRTGRAGNVGEAISFFDPFDPANLDKVDYYIKARAW